ncbi:MAG TPA: hypothetical protein VK174_09880 [Chitinophagales bacterium]|nr:hypothetical protein [Chitinophagales bacterium]
MAAPVHLSKLTSALRQLSPTEMEKFEAYLSSPYFEIPAGALPLFQYLRKFHPVYDEKKTDPEVIQKKAPALGNQKRQANYGSDLLKCLEQFLAIEDFKATPASVDCHRLQAYKKHHLFEMFNKEHEQLLKALDEDSEQSYDAFYQRHILTELALSGFDAKLNRTIQNDVFPVSKTLDEFYALKKLRYHCELLNRHQVLGTTYSEENIDYVLNVLQPLSSESYPYVYLFSTVYKMLKAPSFEEGEKSYLSLRHFFDSHIGSTLMTNIKETITYITNFGLYWNSKGFQKAGAIALWGHEVRMTNDDLLDRGKISPSNFRNIVALAILNKRDAGWIKQFIESYSQHLPDEHKETNQAFAWAQYHYYMTAFDQAMPLFQQAQVKEEPIFNAIVRRWQFMCMYEEDPSSIDVLFDFLNAYERYILRYDEQFHWMKDIFVKNIFYSKKLLKATNVTLKKELRLLLNEEKYFTGKEWLLKHV